MITKLKIKNYKSFNNEIELNMISSNKEKTLSDHRIKFGDMGVLKNAAIYGANAAGKSNLILVFSFFKYILTNNLNTTTENFYCKNEVENQNRSTDLELYFEINNKFYIYGLKSILKKQLIEEEYLYQLYKNGSNKLIFSRDKDCNITYNISTLSAKEKSRLLTYSEDMLGKTNLLFLTMLCKNKNYENSSKLYFLKEIFSYFVNDIHIITPNNKNIFNMYNDSTNLDDISEIISSFDTGITKLKYEKITTDEIPDEVPKEIIEEIRNNFAHNLSTKSTIRSNDNFINFNNVSGELEISVLRANHGSECCNLDYSEESDGTKRILDFIDILLMKGDKVFIIDEIDRSLHPKATEHFMELYHKFHKNDNSQIILSTHESNLLNLNIFRRDEIWFIERDNNNNSAIYSLDRFKERFDKRIDKAYLDGRYGSLPIFKAVNIGGINNATK